MKLFLVAIKNLKNMILIELFICKKLILEKKIIILFLIHQF